MHAPGGENAGATSQAMISLVDMTPTILDYAKAPALPEEIDGRSFRPVVEDPEIKGWDTVFGTHTFHEINAYYPMRMVRTHRYKLIHNIEPALSYPNANDLRFSYSWRYFDQSGEKKFGPRPVDLLFNRPEYELYDLEKDPLEVNNIYENPSYKKVQQNLQRELYSLLKEMNDPWSL